MEFAIRSALPPLGLELVDLDGASCCPDPIYFKSKDKLSWLAVAARNLALAEEQGLDVVTNCSGCTATLSEASHLLEDAALRSQVNDRLARIGRQYAGTSRVRHVVTLLRDVAGHEAIRKSVVRPLEGLKVAIHYGCHLLEAQPDHAGGRSQRSARVGGVGEGAGGDAGAPSELVSVLRQGLPVGGSSRPA